MAISRGLFLLLLFAYSSGASGVRAESKAFANPIRKVVTILQNMMKKVAEETDMAKELFDDFMCACKTDSEKLKKEIEAAEGHIPELDAAVDAGQARKTQLTSEIANAKKDREEAKTSMAEATDIREEQAKKAAKETADMKTDIAAMGKAIVALEKGVSTSFLQSSDGALVRKLVVSQSRSDTDRDVLISFLSQSQDEDADQSEPSTNEVVGILKQMKETMEKDLATTIDEEAKAVESYEALIASKEKEVSELQEKIESMSSRLAEVGVENVNEKEDLEDTEESLEEDKKMLAELEKKCKKRAEEYDEQRKVLSEESVALAETIKILNNDDALELFKKTIKPPSFLQITMQTKDVLQQAHSILVARKHKRKNFRLDLIALLMHGKTADFGKVLTMIDDLVKLLKEEQINDDKKVAGCKKSLEETSDKAAELERKASNLQKAIDDMTEKKSGLMDEIADLKEAITELDKSVETATEQRKKEHEAYKELMSNNKAAVEIVGLAKNRMNKFYNPQIYKKEPVVDDTYSPYFMQVSEHRTLEGKQNDAGVIQMMNTLLLDMEKEMAEAKTSEKDAQEDYDTFMSDSKEKRKTDSKTLEAQESAKADLDARLVLHSDQLKANKERQMNNAMYTSEVHKDCDWIMQNLEVRKEARAGEIDSLVKAKAVLSGADYSFIQTGRTEHRYLRASARK